MERTALKNAILEKHGSLSNAASVLSMHVNSISNYVNGKTSPTEKIKENMARALGVKVESIFPPDQEETEEQKKQKEENEALQKKKEEFKQIVEESAIKYVDWIEMIEEKNEDLSTIRPVEKDDGTLNIRCYKGSLRDHTFFSTGLVIMHGCSYLFRTGIKASCFGDKKFILAGIEYLVREHAIQVDSKPSIINGEICVNLFCHGHSKIKISKGMEIAEVIFLK